MHLNLQMIMELKIRSRIKYFQEYLDSNCTGDFNGNYPLDIKYAQSIKKIVGTYKDYKETSISEHENELEFITKWVHDVKVPIAAINLITENMDTDESTHIEMQLNYIDQNIQKILFHMKSKRFYDDFKIKKVSLKSIVNQALKSYAVFFSYKLISLKIDCAECSVYTDEKWSIYIVSQLISNAVKYTDNNGEISLECRKCENTITLSVKNTGKGIDETNIKNIFKQGYSGYNTRKDKSTGYGLYLSKKLADKMGHKLTATSVPNEFAEFILYYDIEDDNPYYNNVRLND